MGEDAKLFICGSAAMGEGIVKALKEIVVESSGVSESEADNVVKDWEKEHVITKELW